MQKRHLLAPGPTPVPPEVLSAFVLGALAILWVEARAERQPKLGLPSLSSRGAVLIGCAQVIAMWPGMSRSGMTILGAMLLGLSRVEAAEYRFLAAVPVLLAATAFELAKPLLKGEPLGGGMDPMLILAGFAWATRAFRADKPIPARS